ncbi:MAG: hypothetical protein LBR10_07255 [Prevotellaceae bacterium]|jgi:hypothetical protein|nr:hypothetical protein [Prevotellaceae bacterium]
MKDLNYKVLVVLFIFMFLSQHSFSQESNSYVDFPFFQISFKEGKNISFYKLDPNTDIETKLNGIYNVSSRNGVPFLNIIWENNQKETFLMLSNELFCFLYNNDSFPYITGFHGSTPMAGENFLLSPDGIRASSYLIENGKAYLPNNLNSEVGKAWVEGVEGQGIHEKLFIRQSGISAIHISLGFVSYARPNLYEENSRPKKIRVSVEGLFSFEVNLSDTPNFQTINLPKELQKNDILVIEILEVYPGTKYEDTCINCIIYDLRSVSAQVSGAILEE